MSWLLGCILLAGATACSGDDDTTAPKQQEKKTAVKVRRLTITEMEGGAADVKQALTRATLAADDSGLVPSWTAGDGLTYCNLSRLDYMNDDIYTGPLTATTTAAISQFTGDVICFKGDELAVVYPATSFETNESYTISLVGQDGTLGKLATQYHYVYGKASVKSVTETTADATMAKMKSLLTVCKFSFKDKATGEVLPIATLQISYGGNPEIDSRAGKYPQAATVAISYLTDPKDTHASGTNITAPLTIAAGGATEVYVCLLPDSSRKYNFTVANASGTYAGTATATLIEGEYVEATELKLNKITQ